MILGLAVCLLVVSVSCAAEDPVGGDIGDDGKPGLITHSAAGGDSPTELVKGLVRGDPPCLVIETAAANQGQDAVLVWPRGSKISDDAPNVVVDEDDDTLATIGRGARFGGGHYSASEAAYFADKRSLSRCKADAFFLIFSVD